MIKYLTNTKRLGRYHHLSTDNNDYHNSNSPPSFNDRASFYKDTSWKLFLDYDKPLLSRRRRSLEKILSNTRKTIEKSTRFINKISITFKQCAQECRSMTR